MHVVVCIKQVPNTTDVRIDPETNTLIREGVESIINPFDENAIEAALQLKDSLGAKVTVITMGPPQAESALRDALAMGADEVYLISDRALAGSDTWATSYALSQAIRKLGPVDIILCGKQAIDGDTAQVGPGIAEFLDLPIVTYIRKLEVVDGKVRVERVFEDGYEVIESPTPVVLTVLKEMNVPRLPSLKGRMRAKRAEIKTLSAGDIEADPALIGLKGSPTRVVKIFSPPRKSGGMKLDGTSPMDAARIVIEKLKEQRII
ncbi:MAG TPA: electron transfer flavoprotein subunit beta/FixA family protein [Lentisphaerae bacterium]|nr:electron transfer flavoprotein subunit beta/FixA family protein [Lentisphaerota bacterium]